MSCAFLGTSLFTFLPPFLPSFLVLFRPESSERQLYNLFVWKSHCVSSNRLILIAISAIALLDKKLFHGWSHWRKGPFDCLLVAQGQCLRNSQQICILICIDFEYNWHDSYGTHFWLKGPPCLSLSDSGPLRPPVCLLLLRPPQCPAQNPQKASATFVCPVVYLESPKVSRSDHGHTVLCVGGTPKLSYIICCTSVLSRKVQDFIKIIPISN